MSEGRGRARQLILHYIAEFCLSREIGGQPYNGLRSGRFREMRTPEIGALVALSAAPPSKWYLSWLVGFEAGENKFVHEWTLESIEDGETANWHNVSLWALNSETVRSHPEWRWTDAQHDFNDRWRKVCFKDNDAYILLPLQAAFGDGDEVTLGTRVRFGFSDYRGSRTFPDWRSVTDAEMDVFYKESVAEKDRYNAGRNAGRADAETR